MRCDAPVFGLGPLFHIVPVSLVLFCSPWHHPAFQCVCCHSIVDYVVCFSVRVVSLWNGGNGLCWVEERWGWCLLSTCRNMNGVYLSVMTVRVLSCLVALCCGLWNGGGVMGV